MEKKMETEKEEKKFKLEASANSAREETKNYLVRYLSK